MQHLLKNKLLLPNHNLRVKWSFFLLLATGFSAIEIPLRMVFAYDLQGFALWGYWLVTIVYAVDLVARFTVAYYQDGKLVTNKKKIAARYFRGWFVVHFISMIPFELFFLVTSKHDLLFFSALRLIRIFHFSVIQIAIQELTRRFLIIPIIERMVVSLVTILGLMHWITCGWIALKYGHNGTPSLLHTYTDGFFWTITTMTTVGYGDIVPTNVVQKLFTIGVMILGVGMYGYVIGNMASWFAQVDSAKLEHFDQMNRLGSYLRYRKVPVHLQQKIRDFFQLRWEKGYSRKERDLLNMLPPSLHSEISIQLNKEILEKVPMFQKASPGFLGSLATALQPRLYRIGDPIIQEGEPANGMFFISSGAVEVYIKGQVVATLEEGSFFGEMALLSERPRTATVKAGDYCDLFFLEKSVFTKTLQEYPEFQAEIQRFAQERTARNQN
jgi:hypothetical protein